MYQYLLGAQYTKGCIQKLVLLLLQAEVSSWNISVRKAKTESFGGEGKKKKLEQGNTWTKFKELSISKTLTNHLLLETDTVTFWSFYKDEGEIQHLCVCMEISSKSWK